MKGFALTLSLKLERLKATRKWPIHCGSFFQNSVLKLCFLNFNINVSLQIVPVNVPSASLFHAFFLHFAFSVLITADFPEF